MATKRCLGTIEGPAINGNGNPAWRRRCKRVVKVIDDEAYAYCHDHRGTYMTAAGRIARNPEPPREHH